MRTMKVLILFVALSPIVFGQNPQSSQANSQKEISNRQTVSLPLNRIPAKPPAITLQKALKISESYIEENSIDISPYYLREIRLISADPDKGVKESYWWFWWVKPNGAAGDYFELGISMDGKVRRITSM